MDGWAVGWMEVKAVVLRIAYSNKNRNSWSLTSSLLEPATNKPCAEPRHRCCWPPYCVGRGQLASQRRNRRHFHWQRRHSHNWGACRYCSDCSGDDIAAADADAAAVCDDFRWNVARVMNQKICKWRKEINNLLRGFSSLNSRHFLLVLIIMFPLKMGLKAF